MADCLPSLLPGIFARSASFAVRILWLCRAARGGPEDLGDDEIVARLLRLNLERAAKQEAAPTHERGSEEGEGEA